MEYYYYIGLGLRRGEVKFCAVKKKVKSEGGRDDGLLLLAVILYVICWILVHYLLLLHLVMIDIKIRNLDI